MYAVPPHSIPLFPGDPSTATHATVYATAYSDIPVFEAMVRNVAVMMRRSDMWLNATQILKVAGVNKTARTKYLDREISKGVHQKIQGGYGKYQGTWVPYQTGVDLARSFGVLNLLEPVFSLQAHAAQLPLQTPSLGGYSLGTGVGAGTGAGTGHGLAGTGQGGQTADGFSTTGRTLGLMNSSSGSGQNLAHSHSHSLGLGHGHGQPQQGQGEGISGPFTTTALENTSRGRVTAQAQAQGQAQHSMGQVQARLNMPQQQQQQQQHPAYEIMLNPATHSGQQTDYRTQHPGYYPPPTQQQQPSAIPSHLVPGGLKRSYSNLTGTGTGDGVVDVYGSLDFTQPSGAQGTVGFGEERPGKRSRPDDPSLNEYTDGYPGSSGAMSSITDESAGTRLANRPERPGGEDPSQVQAVGNSRAKLLAIFEAGEEGEVDLDTLLIPASSKEGGSRGKRRVVVDDDGIANMEEDEDEEELGLGMEDEPVEVDIDQVIDDRGHTALHWAAALARQGIIAQLIKRGADVNRGNFNGESPLIRAILTTNNAERNSLANLLEVLGESMRTVDWQARTVLHHVALVAGIKGRSNSANYYMSTLLEWLARNESATLDSTTTTTRTGSLKAFVNARDAQGDTALNVAARVGNKNLVKLLLDAGADPARGNKMGLRPVDYGLEVPGLEIVNGFASQPIADPFSQEPYTKGSDLLQRLSTMIQQLNNDFRQEIGTKQSNLDQIHAQVVLVTRELAEERKKITAAQNLVSEVEAVQQRVYNLERVIPLESAFEWFAGQDLIEETDGPVDPVVDLSQEQPAIQLRRIRAWQQRTEGMMEKKMQAIQLAEADKLMQYRKIIATSVKMPVEKVDEPLLDQLTKAIDTDGVQLETSKMTALIQRVNGE